MRRNRHDDWERFCEKHRDLLTETGLPASVVLSEQRFRDLLSEGRILAPDGYDSLEAMASPEWGALYRFASVFFRECESYAPEDLFPAFRTEVQRRGHTFPR